MDNELRYFLQQGPTSVKELARLTGKSTSTIYKAIKDPDVVETGPNGKGLFHIKPAEQSADPEQPIEVPESNKPYESATAAVQPARSPGAPSKRGRKPTAVGKQLYPDASLLGLYDTMENPRRKNSHGYRSLQIIIDNPGITTEDYLEQGGRLNDLRWDIAHGSVRAE